MKSTTLFLATGLLLLAGLGLSGCKPVEALPSKPAIEKPPEVKMVRPKVGPISREVSLPAMVVANQQATLCSKVTGYLKTIAVDKGDIVKAGDLLAEIEAPEWLAEVARCKAEAEIAALDYQRAAEAQAKAPDLVIRQSVDAAKAKADVAKANLERANTMLGFTKITAPFSGTVTRRFVDPGAFVPAATAANAAQGAALLTLADFSIVRVQVTVPESEVPLVKKGLPVKVSLEGLPGRVFEGSITRSAQALDEATRTMLAEIDLKNPSGELRPGMYATVKIAIEKHAEALLLPADAVLFEKAGVSVFTVADDKARKVAVKTGFNDGTFVEILDGVAPQTQVIAFGKLTLNNGQAVKPSESQ